MTAPAASEIPEDNSNSLDVSAILRDMFGARLMKVRAEANSIEGIRRILIAEMAQRDDSPLYCTASFVDVGDLP